MEIKRNGKFLTATQAHESMTSAMLKAKKQMILSLLDEVAPFVEVVNDMYETYYEIKSVDSTRAEQLWDFLVSNHNIKGNSYFGFDSCRTDYYAKITITPRGLVIFSDPTTHKDLDDWKAKMCKGDNAIEYIKHGTFTEEQLDNYIKSIKGLLEYFPAFAGEFFERAFE